MRLLGYFASLSPGRLVLWCYLLWYLVNVWALFDPSPSIWLNSAGISLVIGFALLLSVSNTAGSSLWAGPAKWQTFRLFLMPFCVSSFATLIKGQGYFLIFPSNSRLLGLSVLSCTTFIVACMLLRLATQRASRRTIARGA